MTESQAAQPAPQVTADQLAADPLSATSKSQTRKRGFIGWIARHRQFLTFLGALVVFGTFIVKDALREQLKDSVDAVQNAENAFLMRMDLSRMANELVLLSNDLTGLRFGYQARLNATDKVKIRTASGGYASPAPPNMPDGRLLETVGIMERSCGQLKESLDGSARLLESTPKSIQSMLFPRIQQVDLRMRNLMNDLADTRSHLIQGSHPDTPWKFAGPLTQIESEVHDIEKMTLDYARDAQQANEGRYKIYTWMSYFLYAFGWGLGLIGRLLGVEVGSE